MYAYVSVVALQLVAPPLLVGAFAVIVKVTVCNTFLVCY